MSLRLNDTCLVDLVRAAIALCNLHHLDTISCVANTSEAPVPDCPTEVPEGWVPDPETAIQLPEFLWTRMSKELLFFIGLTAVAIAIVGINVLSLLVHRHMHKTGSPVYILQVGICVMDIVMVVIGYACVLVSNVFELNDIPRACFDSLYFTLTNAPLPLSLTFLLGGILVQSLVCLDRTQGLLSPVDYKVHDRGRRWKLVFGGSYGLALLVTPLVIPQRVDNYPKETACRRPYSPQGTAGLLDELLCRDVDSWARLRIWDPAGVCWEHCSREQQWHQWAGSCKGTQTDSTHAFLALSLILNLTLAFAGARLVKAYRNRKQNAESNKGASSQTLTIIVLSETTLLLLQTLVTIIGQEFGNEEVLVTSGEFWDYVLYGVVVLQLTSSFLAPFFLSSIFRTNLGAVLAWPF